MTQEQLKKLKVELRKHYGAYKEIAERTAFSYDYVRMVVSGLRENDDVLLVATQVLAERQKEKREKQARLEAAIAMAEI